MTGVIGIGIHDNEIESATEQYVIKFISVFFGLVTKYAALRFFGLNVINPPGRPYMLHNKSQLLEKVSTHFNRGT